MQYNLNKDVAIWIDAVRGDMSRQQFMTIILRQQMQQSYHTATTEETNENTISYGVAGPVSQVG